METLQQIALGLAYVVLALIVLIVAKIIKDVTTSYKLDDELTKKDNHAVGLVTLGFYVGAIIVYLGATVDDHIDWEISRPELLSSLGISLLHALGGLLGLIIGRWVNDKFILHRFRNVDEIVRDRNVGAGAAECGSMIATALVIAGAKQGDTGEIWPILVFFLMGQIVLVLFGLFYEWITRYDVLKAIENDNVPAGVALGGSLVAIGILLFRAVSGDIPLAEAEDTFIHHLGDFGYYAGTGFILLMILRKVVDAVLMPGTTLAEEIDRDRNLNAAWLEGGIAMAMATVIIFMI